uniref:Peptidase S1 domain-containing protein n=1 Tax=Varanus komodoensis TaxID=61221 RepID=A0A8D2J8Y1_VARKO
MASISHSGFFDHANWPIIYYPFILRNLAFYPKSSILHCKSVINPLAFSPCSTVCGQPVNSPRIVGGQAAADGSWPWQVTILRRGYFICGGSLIANEWVLSAAHCFFRTCWQSLGWLVHSSISQWGRYNVTVSRVQKIILHPDYNGHVGSLGDIALLKLQTPVEFTGDILPICLPGACVEFPPDTDCWVTGWGMIKEGGEELPLYPQVLQELKAPLISQKACNDIFNNASSKDMAMDPIKAGMICAGFPEGGKDSCQGDSGGPLVCKLGESWTQAGIASFGVGCARPHYPGVYTSVPYYAKWIDYIMASGGGGQICHSILTRKPQLQALKQARIQSVI